ncbi:MAG: hypothetical protein R3F59_20970 [Myxococcota bacterium]
MEHLKYLSLINYAFAALTGLAGAFLVLGGLLGVGSMLMSSTDMVSLAIMAVSMTFASVLVVVLAVLYAVTGRRVAAGRGRILQTVLGVLALGNLPLGTIYGLYALWVCWGNEETKAAFENPSYDDY